MFGEYRMKSKTDRVQLVTCLIISGVSAIANANQSPTGTLPGRPDLSDWELVWQDEFTGSQLDKTKWARCKRGRSNWSNTMSDDPRLLIIDDGVLHLRGIENDDKDKDPAPMVLSYFIRVLRKI